MPLKFGTYSWQLAKESLQYMAELAEVQTYFPSHDTARGLSSKVFKKQALQAMSRS